MRKQPSINDIAKHAHVSTTTVSRVINGHSGVDEKTRATVWKTIRDLGYKVVRHPDSLSGVLVLAPMVSFNNSYWRLVMSGILEEASHSAIPVVFSTALTGAEAREQARKFSTRDGILGVIRACFPMDCDRRDWLPVGPDIASASLLMRSTGNSVDIDMYDAFYRVTRQLIALGHRRLALTINGVAYWALYQRLQGYLDACQEAGISEPEVARIAPTPKAAVWLEQRVTEADRPTAIIGGTSELSRQLYTQILKLKIKVPDDLSFIGVGHQLTFEKPLFDTIVQPTFQLGIESVRTLKRIVSRPDEECVRNNLAAQIISSGTVGPPL